MLKEQENTPTKLKDFFDDQVSKEMYSFAEELWPICRSITGHGLRQTLKLIQARLPGFKLHEVPTGTRCFDWEVPQEWNITEAYLIGPDGKKIIDFKNNNLHVMGYSEPIDKHLTLEELKPHLYSLKAQPTAIPYVTSYYARQWGFCLTHNQLQSLTKGRYYAVIRSELKKGHLTYGELVIPGKSKEEILFSTYACHPSLANDELSGPVVATALAAWILKQPKMKYTYRFYIGPETIGAIVYISRHLAQLKAKVRAGYVISCAGDNRNFSFLRSRQADTLADRLTHHVMKTLVKDFKEYSFLDRGSDERQFCSPGVDLPVVSVLRSRYGEFPEYHTSLDDLSVISPEGLGGTFALLKACVYALENNAAYRITTFCEPQLGKRKLYPDASIKGFNRDLQDMMNVVAYADGKVDLLTLAQLIGLDIFTLIGIAKKLHKAGLLRKVS